MIILLKVRTNVNVTAGYRLIVSFNYSLAVAFRRLGISSKVLQRSLYVHMKDGLQHNL